MDEKFKVILEGVAFNYPMNKYRILKLNSGRGEATLARYAVYKLLTKEGLTPKEIAKLFGVNNYYYIKYAMAKYDSWIKIYPVIRTTYTRLERQVLK